MNKHDCYYKKIREFKQRFAKLPSDTIRDRLHFRFLVKEAAIAYREILEERGEEIYNSVQDSHSESNDEKDSA